MDTQLYKAHLQIERKQFTFDLRENVKGSFLRITESGHDHYNSIIIPEPGLEQFRDSINEMLRFNKPPVVRRTIRSLLRRKAAAPAPAGSADLTMGS
ncbi:MAG: hypothetical protein ACLPT4_16010 [Verrucomicrobiia bacterium]